GDCRTRGRRARGGSAPDDFAGGIAAEHHGHSSAGGSAARDEPASRGVLRMRLLLVGYGKMGQLVEQMALTQGIEIASRIDVGTGDWSAPADVAVDFSAAGGLTDNFPRYVQRKLPVVIGTTGWADVVTLFPEEAPPRGVGGVAGGQFSIVAKA